MNRNLRSYQAIQHTQLNLFQFSNAISLLITAWCTRGCPQLAASCDTLTPCRIVIVFQLQLLWKSLRQRWLVSSIALLYLTFSLVPILLICRLCVRVSLWKDSPSFYCFMSNAWQFCVETVTALSLSLSLSLSLYIYIYICIWSFYYCY